jgi:trk system potassium uptake protein TrkA
MKAIIVGCGRVGALLAGTLDAAGHDVTIIDLVTRSFDRLPATFRGEAIRGDGTDEDVLRRAGADTAGAFLALTEGDNRNIMAAQVARETLEIPVVFAKVNDPVRAEAYSEIGIGTVCRTTMLANALLGALALPAGSEPAIRKGVPHGHADGHAEAHAVAADDQPVAARKD